MISNTLEGNSVCFFARFVSVILEIWLNSLFVKFSPVNLLFDLGFFLPKLSYTEDSAVVMLAELWVKDDRTVNF